MAKAAQKIKDMYLNRAEVDVSEAVATSGMITQFETGYNTQDRVAMEIHAIDYWGYNNAFEALMPGAADAVHLGVTQLYRGGSIPTFASHEGLIDFQRIERFDITAVGVIFPRSPVRTIMPQPVLAHPASLFAFCQGVGIATLTRMRCIVHYKLVDITDDIWQEIWESILIRDRI